jgi:hypothetical protein
LVSGFGLQVHAQPVGVGEHGLDLRQRHFSAVIVGAALARC